MKAIADHPPPEMYQSGLEIDAACARCGSSVDSERCHCDSGFEYDYGDGIYDVELVACDECDGAGVFHRCMSSYDYCQANPLPGREDIPRGKIEWFTVAPLIP